MPSRTRVKICGVRRPADAAFAAKVGADAVGFVLHAASPRNVSLDIARQILAVLPPFVTPVGLFVDETIPTIKRITGEIGLRHIQLNGDESPEFVANLAPLRVIKAVRVEREKFAETLTIWTDAAKKSSHLCGLVLEPAHTGVAGGSGVANDWEVAAKAIATFDTLPPIIAAGGLNASNVAEAIRAIHPYAVDVSSGVEDGVKGEKSIEKMRAFVDAVAIAART
jgi:phosphoribosylanthranilate isomerase